jgi:hypothetical protein
LLLSRGIEDCPNPCTMQQVQVCLLPLQLAITTAGYVDLHSVAYGIDIVAIALQWRLLNELCAIHSGHCWQSTAHSQALVRLGPPETATSAAQLRSVRPKYPEYAVFRLVPHQKQSKWQYIGSGCPSRNRYTILPSGRVRQA